MASVSKTVYNPLNNGKLLKGSDLVAAGVEVCGGVILRVDESQEGFNSPFIIRFDTDVLPGISSMPLNVTNSRTLAAKIGDDTNTWKGWGVLIETTAVRNPQTNARTAGLVIAEAYSPEIVKKERKTKPTITTETETKAKVKGGLPF